MMPPECFLCDADFDPHSGGDLVGYAMRESDHAWRKRMKETGGVGHPPWQAWFCSAHLAAAEELSNLPAGEAMAQLRARFEDAR